MANYSSPYSRGWRFFRLLFCALVFFFLVAPLVVIIPLSFNVEPFFTFTKEMLELEPSAYSLKWYRDVLTSAQWALAVKNSLIVGTSATVLATMLGTSAAVGLSRLNTRARRLILTILISPMIVPIIIVAAGMYFFYSQIGIAQTLFGIIVAHAVLGTPFVVLTVSATLANFDFRLVRVAASLGAKPMRTFFKVILPLILPGVISGALFAFATSFDEVVVVRFLASYDQRTIPIQMWDGIRQQISPAILAVATLLILISIVFLAVFELLRMRMSR